MMTVDAVLRQADAQRAALALDENHREFARLMGILPGAAFHEESDIVWFTMGVGSASFNGVVQCSLPPDVLAVAIERIKAIFQAAALPFQWHIGAGSTTPGLTDMLVAHGIVHDEDEPAMVAPIHTFIDPWLVRSELVVRQITTPEDLAQWGATTYVGAPADEIQRLLTVYAPLGSIPHGPLRLYLATLDGEPVCTASLYFAAGVAEIGRIVTVPAYRRRGFGTRITAYVMGEARRAGYHFAVLQASPQGFPVYQRLGFQTCGLVRSYLWEPNVP